MFSYAFITLIIFLQLVHIQSYVLLTSTHVCQDGNTIGFLQNSGNYSKLGQPIQKANGVCKCMPKNYFVCDPLPSGVNQLPSGQLRCGDKFGCPTELKNTISICGSGTKLGVLRPDGSVLGPGSLKPDGHCVCDKDKLSCNPLPTGSNKLPEWGPKTCVADPACPSGL
ncbi:hypothetical protein O181_036477 [Austropuccinia psidii MF-1]|uniref:Uncharacterized protein n=1 Tax=Austropuccinia psidii MF-1 TaxID=1389203 RepID=A0A9Q3D760_9BASI|nr:hypothetical protein [Austropuccinia psidii MF-1]